ncbi:hypothetical protein Tco_1036003 [Tanacetum coccineum]
MERVHKSQKFLTKGGLIDDMSSGLKDDVWDSIVSAGAAIDWLGITHILWQYLEKQLPMEMNDLLQSLNDIFCVVSLSPADMDGWQWVLDGIFTVKHMSDIVDSAT